MNRITLLRERNEQYAAGFDARNVGLVPRLSLVVLTCLDPRVDPAHFWGLAPGDAKVIRNAGGRVTGAVVEDLAFVAALLKQVTGATVPLELAIVLHTQCGAGRLVEPEFREGIALESGLVAAALERRGFADPRAAIASDIDLLQHSSLRLGGLRVSGHVYDVESGRVTEVVASTDLN